MSLEKIKEASRNSYNRIKDQRQYATLQVQQSAIANMIAKTPEVSTQTKGEAGPLYPDYLR